ncbi:hypothetical protein [Pseudomonas sp. GD03730]|uniref:hypothetical protein n=1 Tax=Pseudomonas sp. GD03730 TaxID=2975375 RepID=UPI002449FF90|nr:hypothetical protein [Pseudomonas sp. GD03730]MDH1403696.1 hypothetical protein [Pseudomonas sp. GD03730]
MIGNSLTITLTGEVLEKFEALAAAGNCSVEDAVAAAIHVKLTESDRVQQAHNCIQRILAHAALMGHGHASPEVRE